MTTGIFITGTDTGVGKTVAAAAMLRLAGREGLRAIGLKPVASGTIYFSGRATGTDATFGPIQSAMTNSPAVVIDSPASLAASISAEPAQVSTGQFITVIMTVTLKSAITSRPSMKLAQKSRPEPARAMALIGSRT